MTKPERVPTYDSCTDIYRRAGIEKVTFAKLSATRWCPDPDIRIGTRPGWNPYRSNRWLRETGRVDIYGRPARATRIGRPARDEEPPDWYVKRPARLLTANESALVCHRERKIIKKMRDLGIGPRPAAVLGGDEGYSVHEVIRTGLQFGWLREEEVPAIRERYRQLKYGNGGPYALTVRARAAAVSRSLDEAA